MTIADPTLEEVRSAAAELGLMLTDADCMSYLALLSGTVAAYRAVDERREPAIEDKGGDRAWREPNDNALGAWYVQTHIQTRTDGPLAGRSVALKDNICLRGVPMMNGSSVLRGYVPDQDATVVSRLLDAGAVIAGKAHCEYMCISGGSHTCAAGPVLNPHNHSRSAGGSSSGCSVLVASGEVDLAVGTDQAGSVQIPASWSGACGLKPTFGLVPYTGIINIAGAIDHAGPITADVSDNALMLEVIAGPDGLDPRQQNLVTHTYRDSLTGDCSGMRIGVLREGFNHPVSEPDVDDAVLAGARGFADLGAIVEEVSVPMHRLAPSIWAPVALEGTVVQLLGNSVGMNVQGHNVTSLIEAIRGWQERADEFSESVKVSLIAGNVFRRRYGGCTYSKAMNLVRSLRRVYDDTLSRFDVLLMPTLPMKATPLPAADAPRELLVQRSFEMIPNTCPFDLTGHPALTIPCGMREGLPVGMMLVGRRFDEPSLYRAAYAFEKAQQWATR